MSDLKHQSVDELRRRESYARRQLNTWYMRGKAICEELQKRGMPTAPLAHNPNFGERVKTCSTCEAESKLPKWRRVLNVLME